MQENWRKSLLALLPECVLRGLFYKALDEKAVPRAADLAEDQQYIGKAYRLKEQGLVAFAEAGVHPSCRVNPACPADR